MALDILFYLLCGFSIGLGEILPMSPGAHEYLIEYMTEFNTHQPLMQLLCHFACLIAVWICLRHRIAYLFRELRLAAKPGRQRKRQPDLSAVLEGRFLRTAAIPMILLLLFRNRIYSAFASLPVLALMLMICGFILFVPQYSRSANRDVRHMSRKDSLILGLFSGLAVIPGFSRTGIALSVGALRGLDKRYALDSVLLLSIPALLILLILDMIALFSLGIAGIGLALLMKTLVAAAASFVSAWIAIMIMRFLSVNTGYAGFAYYSWGLGMFSFILYLML